MQGCEGGTRLRYGLTLVTGMLECLCFTGMAFGYTSLVFVLKENGYFGQLCINVTSTNDTLSSTDCSGQDEQFSLVFTIASFFNSFLCLPFGYLFDRFGTMVTRLLGISLYTTGTLLVAFSSAATSFLLFPALPCIAVGGTLLLLTNMQVGNLFIARRSTIITLCNGALDSSAAVFVIVKVVHEEGLPLRTSFLFLSSCSIILILRTFLLMPKGHIPYHLPENYTYGLTFEKASTYNVEKFERMRDEDELADVKKSSGTDNTPPPPEDRTQAQDSEEAAGLKSCVLSWFFLWNLLWFSIMQLRHFLFIGTLNSMLNRLAHGDQTLVSQYTNAFAITQFFGVLCAPWNGLLMDRHRGKPLTPGETAQEADLRSSYLSLFLTSLQCLLFSMCASMPLLPLQYLTFALQVLNRSFLFGGNAAFISIAFPSCHFGMLYGLVMSLSGVISLLQFPCLSLVKGVMGGDPFYMDVALTLLTLLTLIHPIYTFVHCRKLAHHRKDTQTVAVLGSQLAETKL